MQRYSGQVVIDLRFRRGRGSREPWDHYLATVRTPEGQTSNFRVSAWSEAESPANNAGFDRAAYWALTEAERMHPDLGIHDYAEHDHGRWVITRSRVVRRHRKLVPREYARGLRAIIHALRDLE